VWFYDLSGRIYILNSRALAALNITTETPEPLNAHIDRDAAGELTGVLRDCDPWNFADLPPFFSPERIIVGLKSMVHEADSLGITTSAQIGIAIPPGPYGTERVQPWLEFDQRGELPIRIRLQIEPYACLQNEGEYKYLSALANLDSIAGLGTTELR
jgi:predicted amidohydrolase YtcJ